SSDVCSSDLAEMRAMIAMILISANQNSSSPKTLTPIILTAAMKKTTSSTQIQRGTHRYHNPMYTPIAVASKAATRTISKAKVQRTRNPAKGWMEGEASWTQYPEMRERTRMS